MRVLDALGSICRRVRRLEPRDQRQAKFLTVASLRWMISNKAYALGYWPSYGRLLMLRLRRPDIITEGMVFLGRGVELDVRRGYARLIIGRWVHKHL